MKIGIITFHRTNNYGACLQAIATRFILEKMGHEAYYVDYWPAYHAGKYDILSFNKLRYKSIGGKISCVLRAIRNLKEKKDRKRAFEKFHQEYIIPFCKPITDEFDVVIYGSDQIWRKHSAINNYNPVYFGKNMIATKRNLAFAASMGVLPKNERDRLKVKELVSHLDRIAVREEDLQQLLSELGYSEVERVLDPTLLLSKDEWNQKINIPDYSGRPYVLVYHVARMPFDMDEIKKFATEKGCDIKILHGVVGDKQQKDGYSAADPITFLTLFKHASYTFVSSFHGLAYSIIFEREFFASYQANSNRAETVLKLLGLSDRLIQPHSKIPSLNPIPYDTVKSKLDDKRNRDLQLLSSWLIF